MKIINLRIAVTALGLAALGARAQTPLPIYEPFPANYTNTSSETVAVPAGAATSYRGTRLGDSVTSTVWAIGNSSGGGSSVVVGGAAGLTYPGLYQTPNANLGLFIRTNNTTANRNRGIIFPTNNQGSVYVSFLLNVQQAPSPADTVNPANGRLFAKLDSYAITTITNNSGSSLMAGIWLTTSNTLAISKSSNNAWGADSTSPLAPGTHLVVLRYKFNPDLDDDEVALWVDPGSLGAAEDSVPSPVLTLTPGADVPSLSSFLIYHIGTEVVASMFLDEFRIANSWALVTPTQAVCVPAQVSTPPVSTTVNEGIAAIFSVIAGGSAPTYQWQVSTNSGGSWHNVTDGVGATDAVYWTRPLTPADSGNQYRVVVSVTCGGGSTAASSAATVTVRPAVVTPVGVVVDDVFQDYWYNNLPYDQSNSVWFASAASTLDASSGMAMNGYPPSGTSVTWLGYFTDDTLTNLPVHLSVGRALKGTLVFKGSSIVASNGGLRLGFFDYADGGVRPVADGFGGATAAGTVRGYMVALNYGTIFSGNPFSLYVRNNLGSSDLMGTVNNYLGLGGGPGGQAGVPAFASDVNYTLEFLIARKSVTNVDVTVTVTGNGSAWTHTRSDTTYAFPRFDAVGIRPASSESTASVFEYSRLLVQVVDLPPTPIPLGISSSGSAVTLTWANPVFKLQSAAQANGPYSDLPSATSPYTVPAAGLGTFYRLIAR